jgi:hypothetical protein
MKTSRIPTLLIAVAVLALAAPSTSAGMAVKFFGTATAGDLSPEIEQALADTGIDVAGFGCFELPLLDVRTGLPVGVGVDCLNVFDDMGDAAGDGLQIEAKTFFFLRQGTIVNHGCTSVRPMFAGVGDAGTTHITGSIPPGEFGAEAMPLPECEGAAGVILTTGGFRHVSGEVRLSGAVNLSNAGDGEITFSCVFLMDFGPPRGDRQRNRD